MEDDKWKLQLSYLTDIFAHLNELNLGMQGKNMNIFTFLNKIDAFKKKLLLWRKMAISFNFEMFELVSAKTCNNKPLAKFIAKIIDGHLKKMT